MEAALKSKASRLTKGDKADAGSSRSIKKGEKDKKDSKKPEAKKEKSKSDKKKEADNRVSTNEKNVSIVYNMKFIYIYYSVIKIS